MQRTLVLGIGNTLLSDEGLGIHLLEYLQERHLDLPGVTWEEQSRAPDVILYSTGQAEASTT